MASEALVGQTIDGKYRIERLLGCGGMGAVYTGTHLQLDRTVAVKTLRPELVADQGAMGRFAREARAAARIDHPNAVSVYDFGELPNGGAYLVMELVEGVSLRQAMRDGGLMSLDRVVDVVGQIAAALGAAHARGIVHRDIKPENVMLKAAPGGTQVKVVDFGLAKVLSSDNSTQLSRQSELIGTPKYMAPEQFGPNPVGERVDIYALGIMAYEMLAGRAPFDGTFSEIIGKHLYAPVPAFSTFDADVPEPVERAVQHALVKDPSARTPSAEDFARELAEAVEISSAPFAPAQPRGERTARIIPTDARTEPGQASDDDATRAMTVTADDEESSAVSSERGLETQYDPKLADIATRVRREARMTGVHEPARPTTVMDARRTTSRDSGVLPPTRVHRPPPPSRPAWVVPTATASLAALVVGGATFFAMRSEPTPTQTPPARVIMQQPPATPTETAPAEPSPLPFEETSKPQPAAESQPVSPVETPEPAPPRKETDAPASRPPESPPVASAPAPEPPAPAAPASDLPASSAPASSAPTDQERIERARSRLTPDERAIFDRLVGAGVPPDEALRALKKRRRAIREPRSHKSRQP